MTNQIVTLSRKIREDERDHPSATGNFSNLLEHVALAAKLISREVNKAALVDLVGFTNGVNVQGEEVRKLDEYANETMVRMLGHCGYLAGMASEEETDIIQVTSPQPENKYIILFDPLDGSSNIDANVSVGTIFSILQMEKSSQRAELEDYLQPGVRQVAAGYVIYGSSTMLVYTTGNGVHGFTLDASVGEFLLSHPDIRTPQRGKIFSVNMGNFDRFEEGMVQYIQHLTSENHPHKKPYSMRYIGSLVSDFHRNLLYGGIFMYPGDDRYPQGKLRLLYEANPLGMIVTRAGGKVSTGWENVLEIKPTQLHQRTPLFIGSRDDVNDAEVFIQGKVGSLPLSSVGSGIN